MSENKISNRLVWFSISRDNALDVLRGYLVLDFDSLPEDAKIVNVNADWRSQSIEFLVESEKYDEVPSCTSPPVMDGIRFFVRPEKSES